MNSTTDAAALAADAGAVANAAKELPPLPTFQYAFNEEFRLSGLVCEVSGVRKVNAVGPEYGVVKAAAGATFVLVDMSETNVGSSTAVVRTNGITLIDKVGRRFDISSHAMIALSMGSSHMYGMRKQLQPGLTAKVVLAFEVPSEVADEGLTLELLDVVDTLELRRVALSTRWNANLMPVFRSIISGPPKAGGDLVDLVAAVSVLQTTYKKLGKTHAISLDPIVNGGFSVLPIRLRKLGKDWDAVTDPEIRIFTTYNEGHYVFQKVEYRNVDEAVISSEIKKIQQAALAQPSAR